jgi:Arc/MetJ-type ribon-helix-helix transcriptional regulator
MTVNIRPDQEQGIRATIQGGRFHSVDEFIQTAVDEALRREVVTGGPSPAPLSREQWVQELKAWAASHSGLPVVTEAAMSRESIYSDRGISRLVRR